MNGLVGLGILCLRTCVTSRPGADIGPVLDTLALRSISFCDESRQVKDITEYVGFVIETDPKMRVWRVTEKELVIE